jgi:hypothetical protein
VKLRIPIAFAAGLVPALAAGWLAFPRLLYKSEPQPVSFSHKVHAEKASMACADCHALEADGRFSGLPRLEKCAGCHAQPAGDTAEEKRFVADYVTPGREPAWRVAARQPENVHFPHAAHMALAKLPCERCHGAQGSADTPRAFAVNRVSGESRGVWGPRIARVCLRPGEGMKMTDCIDCHEERGRDTSCLACHK